MVQEKDLQNEELKTQIVDVTKQLQQTAADSKRKQRDMSVKDYEKTRPNVSRVASIVKNVKDKGLKVSEKSDWAAFKSHLYQLMDQEGWPAHFMDLEGPAWIASDEETFLEHKLRIEMFMVIRDSVDWKKHSSKMEVVMEKTDKHDAQALYRRLDALFGVGKEDGDVTGAGVRFRSCTMQSTKLDVFAYGLEIVKRLNVLEDMGLQTHVQKEVIPIYLNGLLNTFKDIRNKIDDDMENDQKWNPTLQDVMNIVERRAVKRNWQMLVSNGKEVSQNSQQTSKGKNKNKKKNKKVKQVEALQSEMKKVQDKLDEIKDGGSKGTVTQNAAATSATGTCNHGSKCWLTNCKFKHAPATNRHQTPQPSLVPSVHELVTRVINVDDVLNVVQTTTCCGIARRRSLKVPLTRGCKCLWSHLQTHTKEHSFT